MMSIASSYRLGLSSEAISGSGTHHPWDPSDLLRCINYCTSAQLNSDDLRRRMAGKSVEWDRLLSEWDHLVSLLKDEMATATDGRAPRTYAEIKRVLNAGVKCAACDGNGRGAECLKCHGTGKRSGGRCRADRWFGGADYCRPCRGEGYTILGGAA